MRFAGAQEPVERNDSKPNSNRLCVSGHEQQALRPSGWWILLSKITCDTNHLSNAESVFTVKASLS